MSRSFRMRRSRKPHRADQPSLFTLTCSTCGRRMVETESGYLSCPAGHGRLHLDSDPISEEPCGSLFDTLSIEE